MRVGIAGCGIRGQLFARSLASMPDVEVVGMCDLSEAVRTRAAEVYAGPIVADHRSLIDLGLDAMIIATPDFAHRDIALDAAAAGLDLMIEKPLATTREDAAAIVEAVEAAGVSCFVAFENRWNPYFRKARRAVREGTLGEIVSITGVLSNSYFVPTEMLSWAGRSSPAWFLMPHLLDLSAWIADAAPVSAVARGRRGELESRGIPTWDTIHALFELDGGAVVNLQTSWVLPDSRPSIVDFRLDIVGTKGELSIDHGDQGLHLADADKYSSLNSLPEEIDGVEQSMASWMVRSWAAGLIGRRPVRPDAQHGALITRAVEAAHQSAESGERIALDALGFAAEKETQS